MNDQFEAADVVNIIVNCMALNNIEALWDRLVDELKGKSASPSKKTRVKKVKETSLETLQKVFAARSTKWCVDC